jgi:hypothetical protein
MPERLRAVLAIALLVAGIAASLLASYVAYGTADHAWNEVADYRSPYVSSTLPPAKAGPPLARRVVLVIVDGLTEAASRKMQALGTLREFGSDLTLTVSQPSLSFPGWTSILTGAPPRVSGVATNGWKGHVQVETLIDTAIAAKKRIVVVGPTTFDSLYGASRAYAHYFRDYDERRPKYLSTDMVLHAVSLVRRTDPEFVLVHLPDVDEAGHKFGAASAEYARTVERVDTDLSVLVNNIQDARTCFVVVADHGHIASGGHGGWEPEVTRVAAVFAGPGVALGQDAARQEDVAPTVAAVAGIPTPRDAFGRIIPSVLATAPPATSAAERDQRSLLLAHYLDVVRGMKPDRDVSAEAAKLSRMSEDQLQATLASADQARLERERRERAPVALAVAGVALLAVALVGVTSWRALLAALAGTAAYHLVYNGLYFGVHRLQLSLSAINSEGRLAAFFNTRMAEALLAALIAALVAGVVYPFLRREAKGSRGRYLAGWLSLGAATAIVIQATLVLPIAHYIWRWGLDVTWILPDLHAGFAADLDMLQIVAVGGAAVLGPVVTLLVGRYHPKVARGVGEGAPSS